jgi:hypothetical protein
MDPWLACLLCFGIGFLLGGLYGYVRTSRFYLRITRAQRYD